MKRFQDWAKREYSMRQRFVVIIFEGVFFVLICPFLLVVNSAEIDRSLHLPRFNAGLVNSIVGLLFVLVGFFLALWSIQTQMTIGMGTPVPMMPTQRLVVKGPFTYCRNPMTLGIFIAYVGISVWMGSLSAIVIILILIGILLIYVKLVEEKELEIRFRFEYLEYKQNTPFLLPRLRRRS
jgi:protein-S-isoprenylcysteine O-methyltransferase Ste14